MRGVKYILLILLSTVLLYGCRSTSAARKQKGQKEQKSERIVHDLLDPPPVQELTASLSFNIGGNKVSGQLRMRRDHSIQISASMLGLVEVARIEFLPDMVVVSDRVHNIYSVCHYADIPYRNELGLDFEVVQALLWNRIFSPGSANLVDASTRLRIDRTDEQGNVYIRDIECGYEFISDGKGRLDAVTRSGGGFRFRIDYADFTAVSGKWKYPSELGVVINTSDSDIDLKVRISSVSTENKSWPDKTQVSRRMKQVTLDELLDNLV